MEIVRPGAARKRSTGSPKRSEGATVASAGPPHGAPIDFLEEGVADDHEGSVRACDGAAPGVRLDRGAGTDQGVGVGLDRLEVGERAKRDRRVGPVAARIRAAGGLGGREATIRMDGRRLVGEVEDDQDGERGDHDGRPERHGRARRGRPSGGLSVCRWPARPGRTRHSAPAPRPTSVKTIGSAKAW